MLSIIDHRRPTVFICSMNTNSGKGLAIPFYDTPFVYYPSWHYDYYTFYRKDRHITYAIQYKMYVYLLINFPTYSKIWKYNFCALCLWCSGILILYGCIEHPERLWRDLSFILPKRSKLVCPTFRRPLLYSIHSQFWDVLMKFNRPTRFDWKMNRRQYWKLFAHFSYNALLWKIVIWIIILSKMV